MRILQRNPKIATIIRLMIFLAVLVLATSLPTPAANADGKSFQIFRGPGGPYEVIVGVLPHKPKVGIMHFSVSVLDPVTKQTVDDAVVLIVANDSEGEPIYQAPALQNPQEPQFYEANITFYTSGQWSLLVKVDSETKGHGEANVPMFISPTSLDPGIEGFVVLLIIVGSITTGVLYLWHSSRRKRPSVISP